MNHKPNLIIFATGEKDPDAGGSGFKNLVEASRDGRLSANILAVVSNYTGGGVEEKANDLGVKFFHFPKAQRTAEGHAALVEEIAGDGEVFIALSGCLWLVPMKESPEDSNPGLDPRYVFNIHPGPLPQFGGNGMYGEHVHTAVMDAYRKGEIKYSAVSMHFATQHYDDGPVFFHYPVEILPTDTPKSLGKWVNIHEHRFQPYITNLVVNKKITWDGENKDSLVVPDGYKYLPS
ncbi:hypothetical protein COU17_03280 [Candidatus Kaiserbacteria bacterium CG10_big_fil_rev_8_21_14_0_10_49_17]|uniref:phosphoribosylglycinamide formyltransferase 1 n=1 Tax=Candidatus Kaiserbacteria bacterium CG10_big_fil_rev_8_21_14_0_10_49_17 TaxID=1974609 RepID=A0A2M6WDS5_9BACT|nr:MAG: hypothetical protein COU17_03280 [Candidatus Kaiserbacteria bacterium CG10_big_fil_rev_8_21_14_0_10_49_17]